MGATACGEVPYAPHPPTVGAGATVDAGLDDASAEGGADEGGTPRPTGPLPTDPACISCARTPCFAPGLACVNDPQCVDCFNDNLGAECATNATWLALLECACEPPSPCVSSCATTCATRP